jgi:tRNA(Glu) U13 pseudouridine synthase TruD
LKLKGLRKPFFSRGERAVLCLPDKLNYRLEADERHPGRKKLILSFELGRGSYATLIVKRVQQAANKKDNQRMGHRAAAQLGAALSGPCDGIR